MKVKKKCIKKRRRMNEGKGGGKEGVEGGGRGKRQGRKKKSYMV